MTIQELPDDVRSKFQSGIVITDAVQCVIALVHNSLDAEASAIVIKLNFKNYQIQVTDNGNGISRDDLELVGKRFMTSKYVASDRSSPILYGYKGQAISSILDVSKSLIIETKTKENDSCYVKEFQGAKARPITENDSFKIGTGTTIIINDFLFNMPIRQKRMNEIFDTEEIKLQLQYLALMHNNVSFTLRNETKGVIVFQKPQTSTLLQSFMIIFGKNLSHSLTPLNYSNQQFKISGFLCLKPQTQNGVQLLYINKRVITKGIVHKFINNLMKEYFVKNYEEVSSEKVSKNFKNCFSLFIIKIDCSKSHYELFTDLKKTIVEFRNWKEILKTIHRAIKRTFESSDKSYNSIFSNDSQQEEKNVHLNVNGEKRKTKNNHGTTLLVNAVKGASAKRLNKPKIDTKNGNTEIPNSPSIHKNNNQRDFNLTKWNISKSSIKNTIGDCTQDSFESPIPKKKLKPLFQKELSVKPKSKSVGEIQDESFMEFYKWLKFKFETDGPALNFYNEFLKCRQSKRQEETSTQFKSPVLGNQLKKTIKLKNPDGVNLNKFSRNKKPMQEDYVIKSGFKNREKYSQLLTVTERNIEFVSDNLKAVDFNYKKLNKNFSNTGVKNKQELFKKWLRFSNRNQNQKEVRKAMKMSQPSEDAFFKNLISFRNMSGSFVHNISSHRGIQENSDCGAVNSWSSHYENSIPLADKAKETNRGDIKEIENRYLFYNEVRSMERNLNFLTFNSPDLNLLETRSVGVQTTLLENVSLVEKRDCVVQTNENMFKISEVFERLPESNSFQSEAGIINSSSARGDEAMKLSFNEEVFSLNFLCPNVEKFEDNSNRQLSDEVKEAKNTDENSGAQETLSFNEFGVKKPRQTTERQSDKSESKETQTIAALWSDCLQEIGNKRISEPFSEISENNTKSGNTELPKTIPLEEIENSAFAFSNFCLTERHCLVPKGLSPKLSDFEVTKVLPLNPQEQSRIKSTINSLENEKLSNVKWEDEATGESSKPIIPNLILNEMRQKAEQNIIRNETKVLSASLPYCPIKCQDSLHSFAFTKELLSQVKIIGQLDKKFIVVKMDVSVPKKMELLCLLDQHAVDERIKLEEIKKEYMSSDGKLISSLLNSSVDCEFKEEVVQLLSNLKNFLLDLGFVFEINNNKCVSVHGVPKFLLETHIKNIKNKKSSSLMDLLQTLISNLIEDAIENRGIVAKVPKIIHDVFCSQACHNAIKFNKELTKETMEEMIHKLKNCSLPFQCAHGRPSVIPIIDLEDFKSTENEKFSPQKFQKFLHENKENTRKYKK